MSKLMSVVVAIIFVFFSVVSVGAETDNSSVDASLQYADDLSETLGVKELYDNLPEDVRKSLKNIGVTSDVDVLDNVSFNSVAKEIIGIISNQFSDVLSSMSVILAVLLLYSLSESFSQTVTGGMMKDVLAVVSGLCIAGVMVVPVTGVIDSAGRAVVTASEFMLMFVPIMFAVLVSCGKALSGAGYYSLMIFAAEGIAQLSAKLIVPMLNVFLGVSVCSAVVPQVRLNSLTDLFAKTIKWILSFSFTIFSALLTFKTLISTSIDSVSTRAVRFTMSSFIPVVGAALSEAYKTVQGSINILKNGLGVFVIFAVTLVFLPIVLRLTLWSFLLSVSKTFSQMLSLDLPGRMLSGISTVISVLLAVLLCIMALFIISTALIITAGGYSQ